MMEDAYKLIEKVRKSGKLEKGTNEVTKSIERGTAKMVVYAGDVDPKEIVQHLAPLCKEKRIPCQEADSRQKLGIAAGLQVPTSAVAVIDAGDAEKELPAAE
ncbi:MAG: ribosomal L7Ae/L30e/S12e/Gadd45 family protein [Candidatus Pacearchaeota archaeon]